MARPARGHHGALPSGCSSVAADICDMPRLLLLPLPWSRGPWSRKLRQSQLFPKQFLKLQVEETPGQTGLGRKVT